MKPNHTRRSLKYQNASYSILLVFAVACSIHNSTADRHVTPGETPPATSETYSPTDPLTSGFFEGNPKGAKAWQEFISTKRYRLAGWNDFHFSEAAQNRLRYALGDSWKSRVSNPYTGGNIDNDQFFRDAAFIVVDVDNDEPQKFGLIILNETAGDKPHEIHWLFERADLSTAVFSWTSSGLGIERYSENGEFQKCRVKWNEVTQEYSCK